MPSTPADPTCVVGPGEIAEVVDDYWILPDGSTRETLDGCQVSPKARLKVFAEEEDEPPRASHAAAPANIPTVITAPDDLTATTIDDPPSVDELPPDTSAIVAVLPPEPERMPPSASVSVTTVVLAVGVAGVASVMGLQAVQAAGNAQGQQQRKEEERERQECGTASDSVLVDMRARLADFRHRKLSMPHDPVDLWERCDFLEERIAQLGQMARAFAKTRRA
jgi:hypothetical protein